MSKSGFTDAPPQGEAITDYDRQHLSLYLRLLDAAASGAPWQEITRVIFGLDADTDHDHAARVYNTHLDRARWMVKKGYGTIIRPSSH